VVDIIRTPFYDLIPPRPFPSPQEGREFLAGLFKETPLSPGACLHEAASAKAGEREG